MRAIARRVQRLETRLALQEDPKAWRIANALYERRRRLAEAQGRPFVAPPPQTQNGPYLSIAETLRRRREELAKEPSFSGAGPKIATDNGN